MEFISQLTSVGEEVGGCERKHGKKSVQISSSQNEENTQFPPRIATDNCKIKSQS